MTNGQQQAFLDYYIDTGPLFCLGASELFTDLFCQHYIVNARVADAVHREVKRYAQQIIWTHGNRSKIPVQQAAKKVLISCKQLFDSVTPSPNPTNHLVIQIKLELSRRSKKSSPRAQQHPASNDGEAESIYWAVTHATEFISNDGNAQKTARGQKITCHTFVDVARRLARVQKQTKRRDLYKELKKIERMQIDIGERITGVLDLV